VEPVKPSLSAQAPNLPFAAVPRKRRKFTDLARVARAIFELLLPEARTGAHQIRASISLAAGVFSIRSCHS
jgi:hypothetical protein